jgi:hypothetical protein
MISRSDLSSEAAQSSAQTPLTERAGKVVWLHLMPVIAYVRAREELATEYSHCVGAVMRVYRVLGARAR